MSKGLSKSDNFWFYSTPDGQIQVEAYFKDETVWLTQQKLAQLFEVDRSVITKHLANIFESQELDQDSVCAKNAQTAKDGKKYQTMFYNLDAIISVGYRVNSTRATDFRRWATVVLRDYMVKGFVLDDRRLKNGSHFGKDYFNQLLERIREIRASERRFYQKITDIYATASDYNPKAEITKQFYAGVQNKLHWAIHGQTAAELIATKADANKAHMGLKTWQQAPSGKILKSDVATAKNYLDQGQIKQLDRLVTMYLDYAEDQAARAQIMSMTSWSNKLDAFLEFNKYQTLNDPGQISHLEAKILAEDEYDRFRPKQDKQFESDFDKVVKKLQSKTKQAP